MIKKIWKRYKHGKKYGGQRYWIKMKHFSASPLPSEEDIETEIEAKASPEKKIEQDIFKELGKRPLTEIEKLETELIREGRMPPGLLVRKIEKYAQELPERIDRLTFEKALAKKLAEHPELTIEEGEVKRVPKPKEPPKLQKKEEAHLPKEPKPEGLLIAG